MKDYKFRNLSFISLIFLLIMFGAVFFSTSAVSAHGADITEDTMILANESNGVIAKDIVDKMGADVKVYKFTSDGDVEHQLEHATTNSNKRILVIAYQDTANKFLDNHTDLKNRVLIVNDDNSSIENGINQLLAVKTGNNSNNENIENNNPNSIGFITPLIAGLAIGLVIGLGAGVFLMKKKNN